MVNTVLGITFLVTGALATFLMYHLWGYPYDKEKLESSAPQSLVFIHRLLGYIYIGIYVYLMIQMVPRMWMYQIELPARTVVHLTCGILIGAILIIKLMIVRFFRHLEGTLIPAMGTLLLLLTVVVISLSVPFAIRESILNRQVLGGATQAENLERVDRLLTQIGVDDTSLRAQLSSTRGLILGRQVLNNKCVTCHDLRTVLVRPKTAKQWWQTVKSMSSRSDIFNPISENEQWQVTAYLIAISPDLQRSAEQQKQISDAHTQSTQAIQSAIGGHESTASQSTSASSTETGGSDSQVTSDPTQVPSITGEANVNLNVANQNTAQNTADTTSTTPAPPAKLAVPVGYNVEQARILFELKCSDCHALSKMENSPPGNLDEVRSLVTRMVEKGMEGSSEEFEILIYYINETYAK